VATSEVGAVLESTVRRIEHVVVLTLIAAAGTPAPGPTDATAQSPVATYPLKRIPFLTYLIDYEPWWSPDGSRIALVSNRHGGLKVHVADASATDHGAGMRQLTFGDAEDDSPAWSPDGKRIAYVSVREGVSQIYVMNADGSDSHPVTSGRAENIHPAWTVDSSRVLFDTTAFAREVSEPQAGGTRVIGDATDDAMDLATVFPDGSDLRRLTTGGGYTYASYSPDGRFIVHRRIRGPVSTIAVMNADGSGERDISGTGTADGWPSWSPDGARVVFARQVGEYPQIFVMNRGGSDVRQLTDTVGRMTNPRWSPDGQTILCSRGFGNMSLVALPAP
jgi:TolB protein